MSQNAVLCGNGLRINIKFGFFYLMGHATASTGQQDIVL